MDDPLQVVASAVTPVVMVSATAILISGVNSRYIAIADRMRALTHEYRDPNCSAKRCGDIRRQMVTFQLRIRLVSWSIRGLYAASGCFVTMALLISATLWRRMLAAATVPLFLAGITLIIVAIICEIFELQASNQTISLEVADVLRAPGKTLAKTGQAVDFEV
jgi:hypothetical protein